MRPPPDECASILSPCTCPCLRACGTYNTESWPAILPPFRINRRPEPYHFSARGGRWSSTLVDRWGRIPDYCGWGGRRGSSSHTSTAFPNFTVGWDERPRTNDEGRIRAARFVLGLWSFVPTPCDLLEGCTSASPPSISRWCRATRAAGLTDHVWTIKELLSTVVAPEPLNTSRGEGQALAL